MQRLRRLSQRCADDVPDFFATGDEVMSTRGRANIIRAALDLRVHGHDPLRRRSWKRRSAIVFPAKVARRMPVECESRAAQGRADPCALRARWFAAAQVRLLSNVDLLGRLGLSVPALANAALDRALSAR